jgi:hypothetical protein
MKTNNQTVVKWVLVAICTLAFGSSGVLAQASRTWVSGVGDDANPGSRTAPCKTFAGAISKTAASGEIDCIDSGGFGAVTITKSITIDGAGVMAGVLASGSNGVTINAGVNDVVTLRNLSINGFGTGLNGIRILSAAEVNIENCVIFEFTQRGIDIAPTANCRVNIKDCIVRGCALGAVHSHPAVGGNVFATIKGTNMLASKFGFRAEDRTKAMLDSCETTGNLEQGIAVATAPVTAEAQVHNCIISDNGTQGVLSQGANAVVRLSENWITGNVTGILRQTSGGIFSAGNNRIRGNTTNGVPTLFAED